MRRSPLALLSIAGALYTYWVIRQLGRWLGALALGIPCRRIIIYKILPAVDVFPRPGGMEPAEIAFLILAAPGLVLLIGYVLLWLLARPANAMPSGLRLFVCLVSYLGLILEPVYYAVIPLLHLGGEPEMVAQIAEVSPVLVALPAMAVLGLNVMLARRRLVPTIKSLSRASP